MDGGTTRNDIIVRTEMGSGTGDVRYQTNDGNWWKRWDGGEVGTGEEIRELYFE